MTKIILVKSRFLYHISEEDYKSLRRSYEDGEISEWEEGSFGRYNQIIKMIEKKYRPTKIDFKA